MGKKSSKEDIQKRRKALLRLRWRGLSLKEIHNLIGEQYDMKFSSLRHDWYTRNEWLSELFDIELHDKEKIVIDILSEEKEIKANLWNLLDEDIQDSVRLGTLKILREMNKEVIELLKSIGFIDVQEETEVKIVLPKDWKE